MAPAGLSMGRKHLKFIQVSRMQVAQLELHPFLTPSHTKQFARNWFHTDHMREVECLLKPVMAGFDLSDPRTVKDKETKRLTHQCLVGPTVRLGFTLRQKTEHHSILIGSCAARGGCKSATIQRVKLVVYVCPRLLGSTGHLNSAFDKLLQDGRKADTIEISSYFPKQLNIPTTNSKALTNTTKTTTASTSKCSTGIQSSCSAKIRTGCSSVIPKTGRELVTDFSDNTSSEQKTGCSAHVTSETLPDTKSVKGGQTDCTMSFPSSFGSSGVTSTEDQKSAMCSPSLVSNSSDAGISAKDKESAMSFSSPVDSHCVTAAIAEDRQSAMSFLSSHCKHGGTGTTEEDKRKALSFSSSVSNRSATDTEMDDRTKALSLSSSVSSCNTETEDKEKALFLSSSVSNCNTETEDKEKALSLSSSVSNCNTETEDKEKALSLSSSVSNCNTETEGRRKALSLSSSVSNCNTETEDKEKALSFSSSVSTCNTETEDKKKNGTSAPHGVNTVYPASDTRHSTNTLSHGTQMETTCDTTSHPHLSQHAAELVIMGVAPTDPGCASSGHHSASDHRKKRSACGGNSSGHGSILHVSDKDHGLEESVPCGVGPHCCVDNECGGGGDCPVVPADSRDEDSLTRQQSTFKSVIKKFERKPPSKDKLPPSHPAVKPATSITKRCGGRSSAHRNSSDPVKLDCVQEQGTKPSTADSRNSKASNKRKSGQRKERELSSPPVKTSRHSEEKKGVRVAADTLESDGEADPPHRSTQHSTAEQARRKEKISGKREKCREGPQTIPAADERLEDGDLPDLLLPDTEKKNNPVGKTKSKKCLQKDAQLSCHHSSSSSKLALQKKAHSVIVTAGGHEDEELWPNLNSGGSKQLSNGRTRKGKPVNVLCESARLPCSTSPTKAKGKGKSFTVVDQYQDDCELPDLVCSDVKDFGMQRKDSGHEETDKHSEHKFSTKESLVKVTKCTSKKSKPSFVSSEKVSISSKKPKHASSSVSSPGVRRFKQGELDPQIPQCTLPEDNTQSSKSSPSPKRKRSSGHGVSTHHQNSGVSGSKARSQQLDRVQRTKVIPSASSSSPPSPRVPMSSRPLKQTTVITSEATHPSKVSNKKEYKDSRETYAPGSKSSLVPNPHDHEHKFTTYSNGEVSKSENGYSHAHKQNLSPRQLQRNTCRSARPPTDRVHGKTASYLQLAKRGAAVVKKRPCLSPEAARSEHPPKTVSPVSRTTRTNPSSDHQSSPVKSKGQKSKRSLSSPPSSAKYSPSRRDRLRGSFKLAAETCRSSHGAGNGDSATCQHFKSAPPSKSKEPHSKSRDTVHSMGSGCVPGSASQGCQSAHKKKPSLSPRKTRKTSSRKPADVNGLTRANISETPPCSDDVSRFSLSSLNTSCADSLPDLTVETQGDSRGPGQRPSHHLPRKKATHGCSVVKDEGSSHTEFDPSTQDRSFGPAHKRQSQASPEENGVSHQSKRRRVASGDRNPVTDLSGNSTGADTQEFGSSNRDRLVVSLSDEELEKRVMGLQEELMAVYHGKEHSERHQAYMQGGRARRMLDQTDQLQCFEEGQEDVVMDVLLKMFTKSSLKDLDYMMRVMLPEALTRIIRQLTAQS